MGFIRIFWKKEIHEAFLPKLALRGKSSIKAQLCSDDSFLSENPDEPHNFTNLIFMRLLQHSIFLKRAFFALITMQTITSDNIQHKWKMFVNSEKYRRNMPINLDNSIVKVQLTFKDISPFFCV